MSNQSTVEGAALAREQAERFRATYTKIQTEVARAMVGQGEIVEGVLSALFAGGHVLLEGVPGLGKTLLVRTLGQAVDLAFSRIQFTPDMMPADIQGTLILVESEGGGHKLEFQEGPLVANLVLADEINRATPKTQSALLEAMQERTVSAPGGPYVLEEPFLVLATQNPIEMEGTYPLPEAQVDRFLFKLKVEAPSQPELIEIMDRTTGAEVPSASQVAEADTVRQMQAFAREVPVAEHVKTFAARLVMATHPKNDASGTMAKRYVRYGASPRGAQALLLAGKVRALVEGRVNVSVDDLQALALAALRHRVILNFEAEAEGIDPDEVIRSTLAEIPASAAASASWTS